MLPRLASNLRSSWRIKVLMYYLLAMENKCELRKAGRHIDVSLFHHCDHNTLEKQQKKEFF